MSRTPMVRLVALPYPGMRRTSYGTRRLTAGDEFEMPRDTAETLIRIGRARLAALPAANPRPEPAPISPPAPASVAQETDAPSATDNEPPRRPRGRPPIHGRYAKR